MNVVTVEAFGNLTSPTQADNIYKGEAWLFRFVIQSPVRFFSAELPHLCAVLKIDFRQIYHIELFGYPGCGLTDVHLFISLFKAPTRKQLRLLQEPLTEGDPPRIADDVLHRMFYEYIKVASRSTKRRVKSYLDKEEENTKRCAIF